VCLQKCVCSQSARDGHELKEEQVAAKAESKEDLDDLITSLIGNDKRPRASVSTSTLSVNDATTSLRVSTPAAGSGIEHSSTEAPPKTRQILSYAPLTTVYEIASEAAKRETVTYSKGVQTSEVWTDSLQREEFEDEDQLSRLGRQRREDELRDQLRKEIEQENAAEREAQLEREAQAAVKAPRGAKLLDTEEANELTSSNDFKDFLERSSKVAERALEEDYDVLADYRAMRSVETDDQSQGQGRNGRGIREVAQFYDERWSKKRMVTDLDFSPKV
jgi:dynein intermediate chain